ncbi:M56 family metallopeptidase [Feifania hominis]|uniref:Peptidase M56 domain-containing protein n=1 Tax=Feifania hominis TaxID=2763660 RepID=A0A926DEY0_9FIRM|nr:M56 family metallopeptidase [Feifania hominis]MBC8536559.1 hypothetical protein [Feifania hominis]
MLYRLFFEVLRMSLTASFVIAAVLAARLLLRRAPRLCCYVLWSVVLFRLLCPVSFTSGLSVLPAGMTARLETLSSPPQIQTSPQAQNLPQAEAPPQTAETADAVSEPGDTDGHRGWNAFAFVWAFGAAAVVLRGMISLLRLRRRLVGAVLAHDHVYLADHIDTPFVLGVLRPKIYLPSQLTGREREYVTLHEQTHIRRGDHIVKLMAFAALAVHWFNPLVWAASALLTADMERSCDESVLRRMGPQIAPEYAGSLLRFATGKRVAAGAPLAFGEGDTTGRIRAVLGYRKRTLWVTAALLAAAAALCFCLAANPMKKAGSLPPGSYLCAEGDRAFPASVTLFEGNRFQFTHSVLSGRIYGGTYRLDGQKLTLSTQDGGDCFVFTALDDRLVFEKEESSALPVYRGESALADGAVFLLERVDRGVSSERRAELLPGRVYHDLTAVGALETTAGELSGYQLYTNSTDITVRVPAGSPVAEVYLYDAGAADWIQCGTIGKGKTEVIFSGLTAARNYYLELSADGTQRVTVTD